MQCCMTKIILLHDHIYVPANNPTSVYSCLHGHIYACCMTHSCFCKQLNIGVQCWHDHVNAFCMTTIMFLQITQHPCTCVCMVIFMFVLHDHNYAPTSNSTSVFSCLHDHTYVCCITTVMLLQPT